MHAKAALLFGCLLLSICAHAVESGKPDAFRRTITLRTPAGEAKIVVPPVQGIEYSALTQSRHGDVLELRGHVVIAVVENGHAHFTLTSEEASVTRQALSSEESAAIADLETMRALDQKYRSKPNPSSEDWQLQEQIDRSNTDRLKQIVARFGWPTYFFGGKVAAEGAFFILQHCEDLDLQERYLPLLREAVRAGQASSESLALLEDRTRIKRGRPQLYGSQLLSMAPLKLAPIEDAEHVDERRAAIGLEPLSDYLKRFGVDSLQGGSAK